MNFIPSFLKKSFFSSFVKKRASSKAFSLIEVSIVLLIIGILIAATISAKALIKNSRIASAQAKTRAAPVNSIPDATIWLESSLESSFSAEEAADGTEITGWNDIKSGSAQSVNDASGTAGSLPVYSNTINSIHAVKFTATDNTSLDINGTNLNNSDYTIFILEKRQAAGTNYFLGDASSSAGEDEQLLLGYSDDVTVIHSQGGTNSYTASVDGYSASENPRIFTFIQNASTGKKIYINGYLAGESSDTTQLSNIGTLKLGKGYTGEIGEFIVFNRALKAEERKATEKYLQEKWRMNINAISTDSSVCTKGSITSTGSCDLSNARCDTPDASSLTGVDSLAADVAAGSGSISCNNPDYADSLSYTCTAGVFSYSGACTPAANCDTNTFAGSSTVIDVLHGGSGSVTCDVLGYAAATIAFDCVNGGLNPTSSTTTCACSAQFTGPTCSTCIDGYTNPSTGCTEIDTAGGYVDDGAGVAREGYSCDAGTVVMGSTETTAIKNHLETGTLTCNATSYNGEEMTYSCNDGTISEDTPCECVTGFDVTTSCTTCASGYVDTDPGAGVVCEQGCVIPDDTFGIVNGTTVAQGSVSIDCNKADRHGTFYTGKQTYTCDSSNVYTANLNTCVAPPLTCDGGTMSCIGGGTLPYCTGGRVMHKFTGAGTLVCGEGDTITNLEYLIVGNGGNGGNGRRTWVYPNWVAKTGGYGGGGEVIYAAGQNLVANDKVTHIWSPRIQGILGGTSINISAISGTNGRNASSSSNGTNGTSGGSNTGAGVSNSITGTSVIYGKQGGGGNPGRGTPGVSGGSGNVGCGGGGGGGLNGTGAAGCPGVVIFTYSTD